MALTDLTLLCYFRGRVALTAILRGIGVSSGDKVAIQAFTCFAVPEAIMALGALPLYVDIESDGFNMDPEDLRKKISHRTRAIIAQHTFGIPADMDRILGIANESQIPVIEDCCHTLTSSYKGKVVGSFGVGSFYSYGWGKPVVMGIGGSAVANDPSLREKVLKEYASYRMPELGSQARLQLQYLAYRLLYRPALYWRVRSLRSLFHTLGAIGAVGGNYNPLCYSRVAEDYSLKMAGPLKARLGRKLAGVSVSAEHSRKTAALYRSGINSPYLKHPVCPDYSGTVFARYPLLVHEKQMLLKKARRANVELSESYSTPVNPLSGRDWHLVQYQAHSCPNAEARCGQVVTLPTHAGTKTNDAERAVHFLNRAEV